MAFETAIRAGNPLYLKIALYSPEKIKMGIAIDSERKTAIRGDHKDVSDNDRNSPSRR